MGLWDGFQKALLDTLEADATLVALVRTIKDFVPPETKMPFVQIGDDIVTDFEDKLQDGADILTIVHVYSDARGSKEVKTIASRIRFVLKNNKPSFPSADDYDFIATAQQDGTMTLLTEENKDGGKIRHAVLKFRFLIEAC